MTAFPRQFFARSSVPKAALDSPFSSVGSEETVFLVLTIKNNALEEKKSVGVQRSGDEQF